MKKLLLLYQVVHALVPKKLYTMRVDTQIDGVKMINGHLGLFGPYYIGIVDNVKLKYMAPKRMRPRELLNEIAAPTNLGRVPPGAVKNADGNQWWITSANVNDTSGHIYLAHPDPRGTSFYSITSEEDATYETVKFSDMNKNKKLDIVSARMVGGAGELMWLAQPGGKKDGWTPKVVHQGMADANFALLDRKGKKYVIVAGRKFSTIGVIWTIEQKGTWLKKDKVRHRVADNYGAYNDIQMVDLNNDGRVDILTSVIKRGASRGHVISYQLPDDFVFGQWKRTVLAGGFDQEGSPGRAEAFWPDVKTRGKTRPHVFVNGAGDGGSYILVPTNPKGGLGFKKMAATPSYGRVGLTWIGDLSGDGKVELVIPQEDKIHIYTYGINAKGKSAFTGHDPMESVENPKLAIIPETRFKSNKPTPKTPPRGRGYGGQAAYGAMSPYGQYMGSPYAQNPYMSQVYSAMSGLYAAGAMSPAAPPSDAQLHQMPNVLLKNGMNQTAHLIESTTASSPKLEVIDLTARSASGTGMDLGTQPGAPADANSTLNNLVPGSNTVVEEYEEFSHPMFALTTGTYENQHLVHNECNAMGRSMCNMKQILTGMHMGPTGLEDTWLWYDTEGRPDELVKTKSCDVAEVLWEGYKCWNGRVETSKTDMLFHHSKDGVKQRVLSQGLCCGVLHGANMTDSVFPHRQLAEAGCRRQNQRLCRAHELLNIWSRSTLKTPGWGWVSENKLAQLTQKCDPEAELWSGYTCYASKIEITAPTASHVTAPAYCCDFESSSIARAVSVILLGILLLL